MTATSSVSDGRTGRSASLAGEGQKVFMGAIPAVHNPIPSERLQRPALQRHPQVKRGVATPAFPALCDFA